MIKQVMATLLIALILAGCSGSPAGQEPAQASALAPETAQSSAPAPAKDIEISFTWWGDTRRNEIFGAVCDDFEAANPGIKVIREPAAFGEYWDKLSTRIAGGNAPDVMGIHANFGSDLATRGVLADLQPFIDSGLFEVDGIADSLIQSSRIGGLLCILPQGITIECMYINQTLLDEVGIDFGIDYKNNNGTFTYASFLDAAKRFTEAAHAKGMSGVYFGAPGGPDNVASLQYWSRTTLGGIDLYKDEGGLGITEEALAKWFALHKELIDIGAAADAATSLEDASAPLEDKLFTRGKVLISSTSANQYSQYQSQMTDSELYLLPFPIAEDGSSYNALVASHFAISNQSGDTHKEAAAKFLNHFFNRESAVSIFKLEQGVPINSKLADSIAKTLDPLSAYVIGFVNDFTAKGARFWVYPPAGSNEFTELLATAAQSVTYGQSSPEDAAKSLYSEAEAAFSKIS
jgi:multiple sugar transport system substrate-binding protein